MVMVSYLRAIALLTILFPAWAGMARAAGITYYVS